MMVQRTINGKPLQEVLKELTKPFKTDDFMLNPFGYYYLPVEKFRKRIDEVVGIFNYDFTTSEPKITIVGTRPHISLMGSITIRDDNGNPVTTKSTCGGAMVTMVNETNEAASLKNDLNSAAIDVFKRCCKSLGMAETQLKNLRVNGKNHIQADSTEPVSLYRVTLLEAFSTVGKKGYGALCQIEGETERRRLMIWESGQKEIEKYITMSNFINRYQAGKSFSLYGYKTVFTRNNGEKIKQLVLTKPYTDSGEGS